MIPEGWKEATVAEVLRIENTRRTPLSQEERALRQGPYPYYGPTRAQDFIDVYKYEGLHALIGEDGDHFLKYRSEPMTQLVSGQFNVNNHAHVLKGTNACLTEWFYFFFQNRSVENALTRQGAKRYKLTKAALEQLPIVIPPVEEQRRIVEILSTWDRAIEATEQLIAKTQAQKKTLMQQLLTSKNRLPGFNGEWRHVRLRSLLTEETKRNRDRKIARVLSVTNHSGIVLPEEQFSKRVASEDVKDYKIIRRGEFAYNPSRLNVGSFARLDGHDEGILSPMYVVFSVDGSKLDSNFFNAWMTTDEARQRVLSNVQGSVRDSVGFDALCGFPFQLPPLAEQIAIANVLMCSDQQTECARSSLAKLKAEKSALMQQLLTGKRRVKLSSAQEEAV